MKLLKEESSIVLSILHLCDDLDTVEKITELIGLSSAAIHHPIYEAALRFHKDHNRFPDFAYLDKCFPEAYLGAAYSGEYSFDIIADFLTGLRQEIAKVKAQEHLVSDDFEEAIKVCSELITTTQHLEDYTVDNAIEEYDKLCSYPSGVMSGVAAIDNLVKGFTLGTMTVIAAPPGMFKTTLALNIAYNALFRGLRVGFVTLELQKRNIYNNLLSRHSQEIGKPIPAENCHKQILSAFTEKGVEITDEMTKRGVPVGKTQYDIFREVAEDFKERGYDNRLKVVSATDVSSWEPAYITKLLEELDDSLGGLDVFVLDYIQILRGFAGNINQSTDFVNNLISHISLSSKTFRGHGFVSFLLSQVNRETIKMLEKTTGDKGMSLSSFAEFHALEREAHYGIILYADANDKAHGNLKLRLIKNRTGAVHEAPQSVAIIPKYGVIGEQSLGEIVGDSNRLRGVMRQNNFFSDAFEDSDVPI